MMNCSIHLAVTIGMLAAVGSTPARAGTRPFSDFLNAQGTFCLEVDGIPGCDLPHAPEPEIITWTGPAPAFNLGAVVDYAGLYDKVLVANGKPSLGTSITGQVNERRLPNGRAEVVVNLQSKNALTYVVDRTNNSSTLSYGRRLAQVLAGAPATLSDCTMQVTFINTTAGAPLPDLLQAAFFSTDDQYIKSVGIACTGKGPLAGGGTATFVMRQTGTLFRTPFRGANADGAPVEFIAIRPVSDSAFQFREVSGQ